MLKEFQAMTGTIRVKVPELLKEQNQDVQDLIHGTRISQVTAYRLAKGQAERISFDILASLCQHFGVGVGDVLEFVPEESSEG
jgi:DNA-binding Xre family transcriptional regulator